MRPDPHLTTTVPFPLLADPAHYVPCPWDLSENPTRLQYWLNLFRRHFPRLCEAAVAEALDRGVPEAETRATTAAATADFLAYLDRMADPAHWPARVNMLTFNRARLDVLQRFGLHDPYRLAKERENQAALRLLPEVLAETDALPDPQRLVRLVEGVFAGNIFDLGASHTMDLFSGGRQVDFRQTREGLAPRPWLVDHLDRLVARLTGSGGGRPYRSAVLFVDNAGPDVLLGMLPFARDLLRRGTDVLLTANSTPALNDITHPELVHLIQQVAAFDPLIAEALAKGRLELVASGNGIALIDLAQVSPALADAVLRRQVDLVVLEGMGRAIETNFHVPFACDALKLAMLKEAGDAQFMGGKLFDLVLRFDEGQAIG